MDRVKPLVLMVRMKQSRTFTLPFNWKGHLMLLSISDSGKDAKSTTSSRYHSRSNDVLSQTKDLVAHSSKFDSIEVHRTRIY
mmetsp:Transcript_92662/g.146498  ORF Transcript_92662/g.146498 Transcript_92662/m.146498 type:complete len:82 (-) Transcript_92662:58-303(-)